MDYAEAREAFFQPRADDAAPAGSEAWALPGRELRHVLEPIATINFWSEPAYAAYEAVGLDFLTGYAWARGCVLGEPEGTVVAAAFGAFDTGAVVGLYDAGRAACSLADVRAARERGAREALEQAVPDDDGMAEVVAILRRGVEAIDITGRAMSAGLSALPWPEDVRAQLWHAATSLREFRGDCHVIACVAHGLTGLEANILTERLIGWAPLSYTGSRAWSPDAMEVATVSLTERRLLDGDGLSDAGRDLRGRIEESTERQVAPVLAAIGDDRAYAIERCGDWADQIVARGWFPPDAYKRAAG